VTVYFRQCSLKSGNMCLVSWIEERGAKVGYRVTLEGEEGWWDVVGVGSYRASAEEVAGMSRAAHDFKKSGSICND
jgi:hypothetical protein